MHQNNQRVSIEFENWERLNIIVHLANFLTLIKLFVKNFKRFDKYLVTMSNVLEKYTYFVFTLCFYINSMGLVYYKEIKQLCSRCIGENKQLDETE